MRGAVDAANALTAQPYATSMQRLRNLRSDLAPCAKSRAVRQLDEHDPVRISVTRSHNPSSAVRAVVFDVDETLINETTEYKFVVGVVLATETVRKET